MMGAVAPVGADPELRAIARPLFTAAEAVGVTQISALVACASFIKKHRAALVDFLEDSIRANRKGNDIHKRVAKQFELVRALLFPGAPDI